MPKSTLTRRKHGFGVPLGDWFRGELRPMVEDTLLSAPRLRRWLKVDGIRALFAEPTAGRADRSDLDAPHPTSCG